MKNLKESNLLINGNEKSEISIINFSKENTFKSNKKLIPIENPNPNLRIKLSNIKIVIIIIIYKYIIKQTIQIKI